MAANVVKTYIAESSTSGSFYRVDVVRAQSGSHTGQLYLRCSCPGGRYSWSPAGFRPCKHSRRVMEREEIVLRDGHFADGAIVTAA